MSMTLRTTSLVVLTTLAMTACDRLPGGSPSMVVVDLTAVAKATGQDAIMQKQMDDGRQELTAQLQEIAQNLETELNEERDKLGDSPTEAEQQALQQKINQAQQQYSQNQTAAQQQVQQFEAGVVLQYRESLQPIVREIAMARGATVVRLADSAVLWFDANVDITADVIAAVRAQAPTEPVSSDAAEPTAPDSEPQVAEPSTESQD